MGTIVLSGTAVLVLFGFENHVYWLIAAAVLYLWMRHGAGADSGPPPPGPGARPGGGSGPGSVPPAHTSYASYKAYRRRRDQQARWERRYQRERPFLGRRP